MHIPFTDALKVSIGNSLRTSKDKNKKTNDKNQYIMLHAKWFERQMAIYPRW